MSTRPPSASRRRSHSRSKTLPALPAGEEKAKPEAALSRSFTVGASDGTDRQNRGSRGRSRNEVEEERLVGPGDRVEPLQAGSSSAPPASLTPPSRKRPASTAQSTNRDYFVYAETASVPTIHLHDPHRRSRTLPATTGSLAPHGGSTSPDSRTRSQSLGEGSSYTRVHVDDGAFWSTEPATSRGTAAQETIRDIDTLPTIPGSSASSDNTQSPPSVPDKEQDSTDSLSSPTISQPIRLQLRRPSTKRHDSTRSNINEAPKQLAESHTIPSQEHRQSATASLSPRSTVRLSPPTRASESTAQEQPRNDPTEFAGQSLRPAYPGRSDPPMTSHSKSERELNVAKSSDKASAHGYTTPPPKTEKIDENDEVGGEESPPTMTRYMSMLLALDKIPRLHNLAASFSTWILLAGFVLFPGTFTSLRNSGVNGNGVTEQVAKTLLSAVNHLSLFVIAFLCSGIGAAGMCYLWWRWRANYVWVVNKIFFPGLMNSLAGVISTISSVYGAQHGQFSITSRVTLGVTGSTTVLCGVLTLYYMLWKIRRVKLEHDEQVGKQKAGKHGEGFIQRIKRKAQEGSRPMVSLA